MDKIIELALQYGGFTSLDRVYLENTLEKLSLEDRWKFITPPPSVINAYFAEIYQKQGAKAATDYFFEMSCHLHLLQNSPSFIEEKPFVRLNLSGKSFGFAYVDEKEIAQIFAEETTEWTPDLFWEIGSIFPHYAVYFQQGGCFLENLSIGSVSQKETGGLLTDIFENEAFIKIVGYNTEEILDVVSRYQGQTYYACEGQKALVYIRK